MFPKYNSPCKMEKKDVTHKLATTTEKVWTFRPDPRTHFPTDMDARYPKVHGSRELRTKH